MIDHTDACAKARIEGPWRMLIDGELVSSDASLPSHDPTTGAHLCDFPAANSEDVDRAVTAARRAFDEGVWWNEWGPSKRARLLTKLAAKLREHSKDLARLQAIDVGMPRGVAQRLDAGALAKNLEYFASWADKIYGETIPQSSPGIFDYTRREPIGVIAALIPWNTPLLMVGSKLGPALAAGNVVILKPSERASLGVLRFAEIVAESAKEIGLPPGVIQVVSGDGSTGAELVGHAGIDKVSFTGGRGTAVLVQTQAAAHLKPLLCELGGKSPNIVFADADLDRVPMLSAMGVFGLSGQACAAGSRMLVERSIHDEMVGRMKEAANGLPVGDPLIPWTMLGPLIDTAHKEHVQSMVDEALAAGAELAWKAELPADVADTGSFFPPHILTGVTPQMRIWHEEVFGPVLVITPFDTEKEAVTLANATDHGLAAGIWSQNVGRAHRVAHRIRAGVIWINTYGQLPSSAPFGGFKQSGWGREGGRDALDEVTQVKNIMVDLG